MVFHPPLAQKMSWRQISNNQLPEPMMILLAAAYMRQHVPNALTLDNEIQIIIYFLTNSMNVHVNCAFHCLKPVFRLSHIYTFTYYI